MTASFDVLAFTGRYAFLSNFFYSPFDWAGLRWGYAENAYQAAKCLDPYQRQLFVRLTPGQAKRMGRKIELRKDWELVKLGYMESVLRHKFVQNPELRVGLLLTRGQRLEEGNAWNDRYWGICPAGSGLGENNLGKVLMKIRDEL